MKCKFCKKHIDEIDCACKMCTICGWLLDAAEVNAAKEENATVPAEKK